MNNNAVTGFAVLVVIVLNILATLFPYYIAYLLIKPEGFMGIVGVFILGSIIVPLALLGLSILTAPLRR